MNHMIKLYCRWIMATVCVGCCLPALAQDQPLQQLQNRFADYRNKNLREKIFVHTDKADYLAGEFIWFRLYYVEGYTHHPLQLSKVAYVEVLDVNNQPLLQTKVSLLPGQESGSLHLPVNMASGNYKLRAYTNWMKNFGAAYYFEKQLSVINPLSNAKEQDRNVQAPEVQVNFFPEGGNLVSGIGSTLAFKINDAYGKGMDGRGWILNERNDTVTTFAPYRFGMGRLTFKPEPSHTYTALVQLSDGRRITKELPAAAPAGYVMHVEDKGTGQVDIEVNTNSTDRTVYLVAATREVVKVAQQATLNNGIAHFTVERGSLAPGITQFTLFNALREPVAERLYFTLPAAALQVQAATDRKEYATREKVDVSMRAAADMASDLSVTVYRVDSLQRPDELNIANYLLLSSDIAGKVESPAYYFSQDPGAAIAADNLMLTQGWRRFRGSDMQSASGNHDLAFPPEINGPIVVGRLTDVRTGAAVQGVQAYLSLPGKRYQIYFSESNSKGIVQFEVKDFYGSGEMIVRPFAEDDSLYHIELQNPYSEEFADHRLPPLKIESARQALLENYSVGMQVRQVYNGDSLSQLSAPQPSDSFSFLGKPEYTYNLDDYTRFTTMEEVLREYVRPINVGVRKGRPHMLFFNETYHATYDKNVLVMLDGVPFYEPDRLFAYDPLKVKRLDIFPRSYVLGPAYFVGVVNFSTYKGAFDGYELDPHLVAVDYDGLQMQREFYVPQYNTPEKQNSRLPDYRNTLYWNPHILTNKNEPTHLTFYTCDQKGRYLGSLQGLDQNGNPLVSYFTFEVK